jgi:lactate permease
LTPWQQIYDPFHNSLLSTLAAFLPAILLLISLGLLRIKAHLAALIGLVSSLLVAVGIFTMPPAMAASSAIFGIAYGLFPIGWIILNVIFLFRLTEEKGLFQVLQASLTAVTQDRRLQLILVAFCFGAFLEGAAGFGTPVAVTASILIGLGFPTLAAGGMALIANTAPVPYAGLGTPVIALQAVTGLDLRALTSAIAVQLSFFDVLIPFWLITALAGWSACFEVWPALLVAGGSFALAQLLVAWLHGPWLVNIISSLVSLAALVFFLRIWKPRRIWRFPGEAQQQAAAAPAYSRQQLFKAWAPWILLSVLVFVWGLPQVKAWLDSFTLIRIHVPFLDGLVLRSPPIVPTARPEPALFDLAWLSASGTAILISALISGLWMGFRPLDLLKQYAATFHQVRFSLLTIAAMMAVGYIARYAGLDAAMGLAFASSGALYPFFGTLLGWLGVFITGSDTSSNVLFGSLQRITATQLGLNPLTMAAANSSGGVMGKMINAQSVVVAATAVRSPGKESELLRYVFFHSLALVALVGLLVMAQVYLFK